MYFRKPAMSMDLAWKSTLGEMHPKARSRERVGRSREKMGVSRGGVRRVGQEGRSRGWVKRVMKRTNQVDDITFSQSMRL